MTVSEDIIVQLAGVITWGVLFLLELAVEEMSRGEMALSFWEQIACGGVLGPDEFSAGDKEG